MQTSFFQLRFQLILKVFLSQQVEAVTADAAQNCVHDPRGKLAVGGVQERPKQSHQQHQPASHPSFKKALRVPGEEGDGTNRRKIEQAALYTPVHDVRRRWSSLVVGWLGQDRNLRPTGTPGGSPSDWLNLPILNKKARNA